jgi:flagellar basal-body rod protein FlgB
MSSSLISDPSLNLAQLALDGLSQKQAAISSNIANVDTPGYSAKTVDFQTTLKNAMNQETDLALKKTDPRHLSPSTKSVGFTTAERTGGTTRADGNNVDIDVELLDQSETQIDYQALTEAVSLKLQLLNDIAQSR